MARLLVPALLIAAACSTPPRSFDGPVGDFTVAVDPGAARLTVRGPDGRMLLDGLPGGPAGGYETPPLVGLASRYADATFDFQAGSFKIEEVICTDCATQPWRGVEGFGDTRGDGDGIAIPLDGGGEARLQPGGAGVLDITVDFPATVNRASIAFACDPDEHFLGFGGQTAAVDHRGFTVPLWVSEDGITKAPFDTYEGIWFLVGRLHSTHTPMPVYLSSRGYALLLDTPYRSLFAMCSEADDAVRVEAWENQLRLHLFWGPTPAEALTRLTSYLGRPRLPPPFTFAPWLDALYGSDNVRRVATKLRDQGVPASVIWTEDWRGGNDESTGYVLEEDWELDRDLYPDFETLAADLHHAGFKFLTYNNSFLDSTVPVYDEAVAGDYTIHDADGNPYLFTGVKFNPTTLLDLSNPAAVDWAKQKYRAGLLAGADGWMADFAEWLPTDAVLASGDDAMVRHNYYPVDWARLNRELIDEQYDADGVDRLFFVRSAYLGSQPLVSVVWAGDQQTDFTTDDGMPSVIPLGIGLGVTGFPYFGHDIAGYMSQSTVPVSRELWFRWVTFGALSPVMRTHHGRSARDNWNWESDQASTDHLRRWADLHIRLFPYLYAMARDAADTGLPMFRAVAIDHPDFAPGWTASDQYQLGDRLLVAPVVEAGATSRAVALPAGTWYRLPAADGVTPAPLVMPAGGGTATVDVALEEIAAFVPAGALLVLLPEGIATLAPSDDPLVTTLEQAADDRELWLWPGGQGAMTEVGGLAYSWDGRGLSGTIGGASFDGNPVSPQRDGDGVVFTVTGPGELVVDGVAHLTITGGAADRTVVVRLRGVD